MLVGLRGVVLVGLVCLLQMSGVAWGADPPSSAAEPETYRVLLRIDPQTNGRDDLEMALRGQLVDLPVELKVVERASTSETFERQAHALATEERADLVVWLGYDLDDRLFVYLSQPGRGRTLVRELGRIGSSSPETVALVVRSVVEALVQGGRIGVEPPSSESQPPPSEPEPPPSDEPASPTPTPSATAPTPTPSATAPPRNAAPRRPTLGAAVTVSYQATGFARARPVVHAVPIGVQLVIGRYAAIFARFRIVIPFAIEHDLVELRVQSFPAELGARGHARIGRWELGGRFAVLVDTLRRAAAPRDDAVDGLGVQTHVLAALSPGLGFGAWVHSRVRLGLDLGVDAYLRQREFVVAGPDGDVSVARTLGWRPWIAAGIGVGIGPRRAFEPDPERQRH